MAHQYSRVGFDSSVKVNEVNLSLYYGGVPFEDESRKLFKILIFCWGIDLLPFEVDPLAVCQCYIDYDVNERRWSVNCSNMMSSHSLCKQQMKIVQNWNSEQFAVPSIWLCYTLPFLIVNHENGSDECSKLKVIMRFHFTFRYIHVDVSQVFTVKLNPYLKIITIWNLSSTRRKTIMFLVLKKKYFKSEKKKKKKKKRKEKKKKERKKERKIQQQQQQQQKPSFLHVRVVLRVHWKQYGV